MEIWTATDTTQTTYLAASVRPDLAPVGTAVDLVHRHQERGYQVSDWVLELAGFTPDVAMEWTQPGAVEAALAAGLTLHAWHEPPNDLCGPWTPLG